MKLLVRRFKALADPCRLKIVKLLESRELCVCEIREALGIPQPTVSKHLKVLEDAGLVESRREGLWVHYRLLDPEEVPGEAAGLLAQMRGLLNDDAEVRLLLAKLPGIDRNLICRKE